MANNHLIEEVRRKAHPVSKDIHDYTPLFDFLADKRIVMIGEASHGTHEFYQIRAQITQKLIAEMGFTAVAVEADFPDAYRVNKYVQGFSNDDSSDEALGDFKRFPRWMWRNSEVLDFVRWLHAYNVTQTKGPKAGFYGLDLYSLHTSMEAVINYLENVDPDAAKRARYRYSCFDHYGEDPQTYGYAVSFGVSEPCETEAVNQLVELRNKAAEYIGKDGKAAAEAFFSAEQNARLAKNAETYYRSMFQGRVSSWNIRDQHMADTLDALVSHLDRQHNGQSKVVVWAHNSHLGDARATYMNEIGELNLGQLARERYGDQAANIGFTTYTGTVAAASNWDAPAENKRVRPSLPDSYEIIFHETNIPRFLLMTKGVEGLNQPRLERAIGVIYRPDTERISHYFNAHLADQFDAVIHVDETRAVEPLDRTPGWAEDEVPETYPTGI